MGLKKLIDLEFYDEIDGLNAVVYLYNYNHFNYLDKMIHKMKSVELFAHVMEYVFQIPQNIIDYISSKKKAYMIRNDNFEIEEIQLVGENVEVYTIKRDQIKSLLINGLEAKDFINSGETFVKSFYLESEKPISSFDDYYVDFDDEDEDDSYSYATNIIYFELHLTRRKKHVYNFFFYTDFYYNGNYLQRIWNNGDLKGFSFDFTKISNKYFKNYFIEEMVKSNLDLPYDHNLTKEDINKHDSLVIHLYSEEVFLTYERIEEDILKLVSIERLNLIVSDNYDELGVIDLSNLVNLKKLKELYIRAKNFEIQGLEVLAKNKINVELQTYNKEEYKHFSKIFKENNAEFTIN